MYGIKIFNNHFLKALLEQLKISLKAFLLDQLFTLGGSYMVEASHLQIAKNWRLDYSEKETLTEKGCFSAYFKY